MHVGSLHGSAAALARCRWCAFTIRKRSHPVESNHASMLPQEIDDVVFHPGSLRQTPQRLRVDPPVSTAQLARLSSLLHAA